MPRASRTEITKARAIVYQRDGHWCQMCGASMLNIPSSVHHRKARGAGGSALLEMPSNLVRICGDGVQGCHGFVESHRNHATGTGWLISKLSGVHPATVPLLTISGWVLLDDLGNVTPCDEDGQVVA